MPTGDAQQFPSSIRPLLKKVGLDEKQSEVYLALLSLKSAKASDIATLAKQSRSHTYLMLRALEEMGLVSEIDERGIMRFIAEPPERILSYLKDRERDYRELQSLVEGALPVLSSMTQTYAGAPRVTVLKGMEGMKQVYRDILTQEFIGLYNAQTSLSLFGENIVTKLFGPDVTLRGRDLLVDNEGAKRYIKTTPINEDYAIRLLPKNVSFDTDTIVFGDTVTFFAFDDERTIVRIENQKIADSFRAWFEVLWAMSKEVMISTQTTPLP